MIKKMKKNKKSKKHFDIDEHEKEIIKEFEDGEFVSVDDVGQEKRIAKRAARNFVKRDSRINIRISGADLSMIRDIAEEEGLPYQTLLASVIHKYATGRLVDKGGSSRSK